VARLDPEQARGVGEADLSSVMESPTVVRHLPEPVRETVQLAFTDGLDQVFTVAAAIAAVSIAMTLFLPDLELRGSMPSEDPEATAAEIRSETAP
ncbi:MAG TPA: MFS transporter, partial [Glycomyces sp.]|nr:MFS transporter [Glycomyces sp.]